MNSIDAGAFSLHWLKNNCFFVDLWEEFASSPQNMQAIVLLTLKWKRGLPYVPLNPKKDEEHWVILPKEFNAARKSSIGAGASFGAPFQVVVCATREEAINPFLKSYAPHAGEMDRGDLGIIAHGSFAIQQSFIAYPEPSLYRWCFSNDADAMVVWRSAAHSRFQALLSERCSSTEAPAP
jgi:hypothetical protein